MNLRSLLPRRHAHDVPRLPLIERNDRDERLERLPTPGELELLERHRL
ncbi:hypothetical protein ACWDSJ_13785 [Nocardia sp. NPDC003482]